MSPDGVLSGSNEQDCELHCDSHGRDLILTGSADQDVMLPLFLPKCDVVVVKQKWCCSWDAHRARLQVRCRQLRRRPVAHLVRFWQAVLRLGRRMGPQIPRLHVNTFTVS